ncbi:tetratricopeptide repeat protein [Streptacidiphilus sp. EB129]|uniref:tetratricopeptide repeat protein n=1 Tax=Streptacidiphilus sp. EB129 TaxID=3156262 RepID=UPI00351815CF
MSEDQAEQIRAAMGENHHSPNGALRNARAEELVARAERTGDRGLLLETLSALITAYEYSAERSKMFVPFARMLQMWDEDAGQFDDQMAYELFWRFKWVTGSMIDYPDIPLASIEHWLVEMERRYRLAGYNSRTVRVEEYYVARHLGDLPRTERAYAEWTAGERDRMSNCHACEAGGLGYWEAEQGHDERAMELWDPVLGGRLSCAEEPHRVLSYSLLPLLRLGLLDQARSNHLRGYRMARGNESLLPTIARHIEFCALTGNEARGLEILAEHARHLADGGNPDSTLSFAESAVLLLGRVRTLGLGEQAVTGPQGRGWTVATLLDHSEALRVDLGARFDQRNGTDAVSRRSAGAVAQQPLFDRLPLGVNAVLPGTAPVRPKAASSARRDGAQTDGAETHGGDTDGAGPDRVQQLLTEARRLRDSGHPTSRQAWLAVEAALGERGEQDEQRGEQQNEPQCEPQREPLLRAELAVQRGIRAGGADRSTAEAAFREAAAEFRAAGEPGEAAINEARAALSVAFGDAPDEARIRAAAAVALATAEYVTGRATARQLAVTLLCQARVLALLVTERGAEEHRPAAEEALAELRRVADSAPADPDATAAPDTRRLLALLADAHHTRAALVQREPGPAAAELRAAADGFLRAEEPWRAADALVPLSRIQAEQGDPAAAEATALEALRLGADFLEPVEIGQTRLLLADLLSGREAYEETVQHALEATRWLDEAGQGAHLGAVARYRLAHAYQALGRHAEAAEVLQAALPDLLAHGEQAEVGARRMLGDCLGELREHADAAEQFARAAQVAEGWGDPGALAQLASRTAESLSAAGRAEQADAAYLRAQGLWAEAGVPTMVVRTLRARAWQTFAAGRSADPGRALMLEAAQVAAAALAEPAGAERPDQPSGQQPEMRLDPEHAAALRHELADTWRQLAALLRDVAEDEGWNDAELVGGSQPELYRESWELFRRAADAFAALGGPGTTLAVQARTDGAAVRIALEEHGAAVAELTEALALIDPDDQRQAALAGRAQSMLDWLERQGTAEDSVGGRG